MSTDPDWPANTDLIHLESTDSTNAEAVRRAKNIQAPTWILADTQTQGRGRSGRNWSAPKGNLAATLIYKPDARPGTAALRSFVASLALYDALAAFADPEDIALKWPNDVLVKGGKIAGILLETAGTGDRVNWLAVGIGVNLAHAPAPDPDATFAPVSLGAAVSPRRFLTHLAAAYATHEAVFCTHGFAPIRTRWLSHAARLGERIRARTMRNEFRGTFDTIDQTGNLVLTTSAGTQKIAAADVFFD